jgi:[acyl-carrier-protein] S-malonyltransferase
LKEQLYKPVRWVETINHLNAKGVTKFVECGPGKVLMALNKRIVKDAEHLAIFDSGSLTQVVEQLND